MSEQKSQPIEPGSLLIGAIIFAGGLLVGLVVGWGNCGGAG